MIPLIEEEIERKCFAILKAKQKYVVEMPTFFEVRGLDYKNDDYYVAFIMADIHSRKQRIMKRNNLTEQEAQDRIFSQLKDEEKMKVADEVIRNYDPEIFTKSVEEFIKDWEEGHVI